MKRKKRGLSAQEILLPAWTQGLPIKIKAILLNRCEYFTPPVSPGDLTREMVREHGENWLSAPTMGPKRFRELMAYIGAGPPIPPMWPERRRP